MGRVRALLAGLLLTLVAAPAAHAQGLADPLGSPVDDLQAAADPAHVLIFTETAAFRHTEAIEQGTPKIVAALEAAGITVRRLRGLSDLQLLDASLARVRRDRDVPDLRRPVDRARREGGARALHGVRQAASPRSTTRPTCAATSPGGTTLVGSLMPGHAATGIEPRPARRDHRRGPRPPVHPAPRRHPLGARGRVVQLRDQRPRHRPRAALDGRERRTTRAATRWATTTRSPGASPTTAAAPSSPRSATSAPTTTSRQFLQHLVGGIQYAAGVEAGDCGGTVNANFEKVTLDDNTSAPFALDVAPDGRVFFTELVRGQIRVYDPAEAASRPRSRSTSTPAARTACSASRVDPDFATTASSTSTTRPTGRTTADPSSFFSRVSPLHRRRELGRSTRRRSS